LASHETTQYLTTDNAPVYHAMKLKSVRHEAVSGQKLPAGLAIPFGSRQDAKIDMSADISFG